MTIDQALQIGQGVQPAPSPLSPDALPAPEQLSLSPQDLLGYFRLPELTRTMEDNALLVAFACLCIGAVLTPGVIAVMKGRSFWGFTILGLFITPILSAAIAACVSTDYEALKKGPAHKGAILLCATALVVLLCQAIVAYGYWVSTLNNGWNGYGASVGLGVVLLFVVSLWRGWSLITTAAVGGILSAIAFYATQ
jgi:hypothetical protein